MLARIITIILSIILIGISLYCLYRIYKFEKTQTKDNK